MRRVNSVTRAGLERHLPDVLPVKRHICSQLTCVLISLRTRCGRVCRALARVRVFWARECLRLSQAAVFYVLVLAVRYRPVAERQYDTHASHWANYFRQLFSPKRV